MFGVVRVMVFVPDFVVYFFMVVFVLVDWMVSCKVYLLLFVNLFFRVVIMIDFGGVLLLFLML